MINKKATDEGLTIVKNFINIARKQRGLEPLVYPVGVTGGELYDKDTTGHADCKAFEDEGGMCEHESHKKYE